MVMECSITDGAGEVSIAALVSVSVVASPRGNASRSARPPGAPQREPALGPPCGAVPLPDVGLLHAHQLLEVAPGTDPSQAGALAALGGREPVGTGLTEHRADQVQY